ncbi:MAG: gluzincin family metallopeptidase [Planctomycetota bacterium]|jgi:hypothetical protein
MGRHTACFAVILLLSLGSTAGPITLGRSHKDESNGFRIRPPHKWEQVPTKFQDVALIARWTGDAKRGRIRPELRVVRLLSATVQEQPETPADAVKRGMPGYADLLRKQPKDLWDYLAKLMPRRMKLIEDDPEFKMSSKKYKAHLRVYREEGSDDRRAQQLRRLVVAAQISTVEESDSIFGVAYFTSVADEKNMRRTFKTSIKRFKILDPDEEEELEEGEEPVGDEGIFVDSAQKPKEWREARKNKLKGVKGWAALDTANYLIVHNKEVKRPLLKKIARHIEAIRRDVYEKLFPPAKDIKAISVVRVCKDREEYLRYGAPPSSAGYWSPGDEELVFYQDRSNKKDSLRVLYHEAFHQYIHYSVGQVAPHSWFNEGHGDYFAGHNYRGGKFRADVFRWRTGIIANALGQKTYVPLEQFLKYTQREYYSTAGLCYAQGWSLIYFLREVERRKIKKYKKYWGLLDRYFEAIKRNVKSVREDALEGLDPPEEDEKDGEEKEKDADGPKLEEGEKGPKAKPGLPRLPGLEGDFPGEHPDAGAGEPVGGGGGSGAGGGGNGGGQGPGGKGRRTVAGPRVDDRRSALDAAVDEVFLKNREIDIKQLEKDWVAWSK